MFRKLENECKISFDLVAQGPVCIRSGESFELNPGEPDIAVLKSMWNGKMQPVIPGSSIKGVIEAGPKNTWKVPVLSLINHA